MKSYRTLLLAIFISVAGYAQSTDNPAQYMEQIGKVENALSHKYLSYMSAASHKRNIKKIEKKRDDLVNSINEARMKIYDLPSYNGDKTIRDSAVNYLKIVYSIFNEDYAKLVNMEEIAEQSYDHMEAYLLMQQKAGERLKEAANSYADAQKLFAANNNVKLINTKSELDEKLEMVGKVQDYYNDLYLIFFKAYKQEFFFLEALKIKNTNAMEQNRNALLKYSEEGLAKLKELKGFNSDRTVETACRKMLDFYKEEGEKHFPMMSDFLMKSENFDKIKSSFETSSKSREDVDKYNKAVADINKGADQYNRVNNQLNLQRTEMLNNYENTVNGFMDTHMPYAN